MLAAPNLAGPESIRTGSVLQLLNTGNAVIVHGRTTVWATNTAGR